MKCPRCGKEQEVTGAFCMECGAPLNSQPQPNVPPQQGNGYYTQQQVPPNNYGNPNYNHQQQNGYGMPNQNMYRKPPKKNPAIIALRIVLGVAAIIIGIFLIIKALSNIASNDGEWEKVDSGTTQNEQTNQGDSDVVQEPEKEFFAVGETAVQNDVSVTLVSATESMGSTFSEPEDGNVFVICEFEIVNNSTKDLAISSLICFEAYCDDYSITQSLTGLLVDEAKGKNQLDGSVAAGKKMNGVIAYEVPADYTNLEITVSPDFWKNGAKFLVTK